MIIRIIIIFVFHLFILQAAFAKGYAEWFVTDTPRSKGQALVIHGLNLRPDKMKEIINEINLRGHDALLIRLFGHNDDLDQMKKATYATWMEQVKNGYLTVLEKNKQDGGKISFVGFSLGGLLEMDFLVTSDIHVDQAVLFAPALKIKDAGRLVKYLRFLGSDFILPSVSPKEYRAQQDGTSIAAYLALFESADHLESGAIEKINLPTTVFINPNDELVSYSGLKSMKEKLNQWKLIEVSTEKTELKKAYNHLIIDKESLGKDEWEEKIIPAFDSHFGKKSRL